MDFLFSSDYGLSRFIFQRGLAAVYCVAFLVAVSQFLPLLGENGLLPAPKFLQFVNFRQAPSVFHFYYSDKFLLAAAWFGLLLSAVILFGLSEKFPWWGASLLWVAVWFIYLSIVNVGQTFYSFGWETMLLEAGFIAVFFGNSKIATPMLVILLLRWTLFRVEFGAGMIKLRGDECWRNLTCLFYHHETQPMPNPLSWYFHNLPPGIHKLEVLGNHFFQLVAPWGLFLPQPVAAVSGALIIFSQLWLVLSGNFSWLNWLAILLAISAFPNGWLSKILPGGGGPSVGLSGLSPPVHQGFVFLAAALFVVLSWWPLRNLFSRNQAMNASFNEWHLGNTYGAFGTVTKERHEIVIEGTRDSAVTPETVWQEYEFKGKPGDVLKRLAQFAPYHLRLDWLMWFEAFNRPGFYSDWFVVFIRKLLENDKSILALIGRNPFSDTPPKFIRARYYRYKFTTPAERRQTGAWWKRTLVAEYFPPVSLRGEDSGR